MEEFYKEPMLSQQALDISERIMRAASANVYPEAIKAFDGATLPGLEPLQLNPYLQICHEFLERDEILSDELLKERKAFFSEMAELKSYLPGGKRCCVVTIPCTKDGGRLTDEQIKNGEHLRTLVLDDDDSTLGGFTLDKCGIYRILPKEIRQRLTFRIPEYESDNIFVVSAAERERFIKAYEAAYREAQKIFNVGDLNIQ